MKEFPMRKIAFILLVLLIVPVVLIGWDYPEVNEINHDTQAIIELSKPLLQEGKNTYIIKWSGELGGYTANASFQNTYNELSSQLGFQTNSEIDYINGLPVLRSSTQLTDGALLQWMYVGSEDQNNSVLMLKLTADSYIDYQKIVALQLETEEKLTRLNLEGKWNTMIQGTLTNIEPGDEPEAILQKLSKEVKGTEQELYADEHTLSASLFTKKLKGSVQSGSHLVNLQIALHQNSITKEWRLTLGSPLITMEY
jgi:hypothetical protein